jgi:hypothetical protein
VEDAEKHNSETDRPVQSFYNTIIGFYLGPNGYPLKEFVDKDISDLGQHSVEKDYEHTLRIMIGVKVGKQLQGLIEQLANIIKKFHSSRRLCVIPAAVIRQRRLGPAVLLHQ